MYSVLSARNSKFLEVINLTQNLLPTSAVSLVLNSVSAVTEVPFLMALEKLCVFLPLSRLVTPSKGACWPVTLVLSKLQLGCFCTKLEAGHSGEG